MKIINPYRFASSTGSLLLDETGIGSAHAAYSVARKLRDAYTGSAFRVRRSSDNAQQDIGFSSDVLDTASLETFCSGTNGYVVTFYDQSGNGYNATQATAGNQGQIVASGSTLTDGGKPAISVSTTVSYFYTGGAASFSAATMLAVCNVDSANGYNQIKMVVGFGNTSDNYKAAHIGYGVYNSVPDINKPTVIIRGNTGALSAAANTNQLIMLGFINGTSQSLYENDTAEVSETGANALAATIDNVRLCAHIGGSFQQTDGYWQEGVVWKSDLEAYVATIKSNVNTFYSIY